MKDGQDLVTTTRNYYDSSDADNFYHSIWGGEDIHVGIYARPDEDISTASRRTVKEMLAMLPELSPSDQVLDVGAGYGGAARQIVADQPCQVTCLNLSETENQRNREKNRSLGLENHIEVRQGNFETLPFERDQFDLVWSEDAILHSDAKARVFAEIARVLKPGGKFIFTDPMQSDNCPDGVLQPILDRIHLKELGSVKLYRDLADQVGFKEIQVREMADQLTTHYSRVLEELTARENKLAGVCSPGYIQRMKAGLNHWIEGGKKGYLNWGILLFEKKK
jgi:sarcosine/dimethylglycine N-methyltransferase